MQFNRNRAIISFLKNNEEKKFTSYQISEWLAKTYPEECKKKAAKSKNKLLCNITDPLKRKKIIITLY